MFDLTSEEILVLKKLDSPSKIQDFLETLEPNFEFFGDRCMSPRQVLREKKAHCVEGAMIAALALRLQGFKPLVVDLTSNKKDYDHVIAIFKKNGFWGAISKSNHAHMRYRDPIYKTIRELVISYFNEYFLNTGEKTLRSYTNPINLARFDRRGWMTSEEDVWYVPEYLVDVKHIQLLDRKQIKTLRKVDPIEVAAGKLELWNKKDKNAVKNHYQWDKTHKGPEL